jgi:hypothetical protein
VVSRLERTGLGREELPDLSLAREVSAPLLNVASGAHSVIIRSTFCVDALCHVLSIWSMA